LNRNGISKRIKVKRLSDRARYDRAEIYPIVDAANLCHVGFADGDQPFVIPMALARDGDSLYLHGPTKGRIMKHLGSGAKICVTITHLDGLVLAKSQFHHSMNYRSAVLFGTCREVTDPEEKDLGLKKLVRHLAEGQESYARPGNPGELKATSLLRFEIEEASAKIRTGPPKDSTEDQKLEIWSGVIPLSQKADQPIPDDGDNMPDHIKALYKKLMG
jgi:uncharacterized protein